jgi:Cu/Ag efflux protein CusF
MRERRRAERRPANIQEEGVLMMRNLTAVVFCAAAVALASCSSVDSDMRSAMGMATPTPLAGTLEQNSVTVTAQVISIDQKKRTAVLQGPEGNRFTVKVDDRVKNLAQVKAGDSVAATYFESIAYEVKKPGQAVPGVNVAAAGDAAQAGQLPGAAVGRAVTVTSTIVGLDEKNGTVTLQPPDGGEPITIKVRDPSKLKQVKKGDLVEVTYTEALAIGVEAKP